MIYIIELIEAVARLGVVLGVILGFLVLLALIRHL